MRRLVVGSLALALLFPAATARAEEVSKTVDSTLADDRYRFCHEDDYPLAPDEHDWCPILGAYNRACPALPRACRLPAVDRSASNPFFVGRGGNRHARAGDTPAGASGDDDARRRPASCNRPESNLDASAMSAAARFVFVTLILALVAFVGRLVLKNFTRSRGRPDEAPELQEDPKVEAAIVARGAVETDVERLLGRARAAAASGDYARAIDDSFAALLRRLDGDGLIEIHTSRTNGDYVRALAASPELRAAVRDIVRDVEDVQFGTRPASDAAFKAVFARVAPIVTRVAASGLLAVGLALGLGATLSCGEGANGSGSSGFAGTTPSGTQAIIEVLSKHRLDVRHRSAPLTEMKDALTLVLYPDAYLDETTTKSLLAWVRDDGGTLVFAGLTRPELGLRIVEKSGATTIDGGDASDAVDAGSSASPTEWDTSLRVAHGQRWAGHPVLSAPGSARLEAAPTDADGGVPEASAMEGAVLLRDGAPFLTDRALGKGRVVVIADERLLVNAALAADENATFLAALFFHVTPPHEGLRVVELVDSWTGAGSKTPLEAVDRANLTPFMVQLMVLAALVLLWKGIAFARLRDPPLAARRAFVDHAHALALAYRRSRASRHATSLYASWAVDRLRARVHRSGRQGLIPLSEAIAARTGKPEGDIMRVLVDAVAARDEANGPPSEARAPVKRPAERAEDLALVDALFTFLRATGGSTKAAPTATAAEPGETNDADRAP